MVLGLVEIKLDCVRNQKSNNFYKIIKLIIHLNTLFVFYFKIRK